MQLHKSLTSWGSSGFDQTFRQEVQELNSAALPLQQGLSYCSQVSESAINVVILASAELEHSIQVKTGIFYTGIIAGSCCSDDPTPVDEQSEYCELLFIIDKFSAETQVSLLES
ncbi:MAG: hypothetical protein OEZ68_08870 [Gammaproteobacteria bacterium]|nr:hypothetical protein [Gammaproteobacteria bacterium]MDH5800899.1 hypothetical protein [Gammaproteobacteria bacterium]